MWPRSCWNNKGGFTLDNGEQQDTRDRIDCMNEVPMCVYLCVCFFE